MTVNLTFTISVDLYAEGLHHANVIASNIESNLYQYITERKLSAKIHQIIINISESISNSLTLNERISK